MALLSHKIQNLLQLPFTESVIDSVCSLFRSWKDVGLKLF